MKRHVVLIGLPGAGKTTVGQLVAERLQAGFVDVDTVLVRREGRPVTMIFAEKGEGAFRELERKEMESALANQPAIIAPGGGWAAQPGAIEGAKPRALVIYLRARADTAAQRAEPQGTRWSGCASCSRSGKRRISRRTRRSTPIARPRPKSPRKS